MKINYKKVLSVGSVVLIVSFSVYYFYIYYLNQKTYEKLNICQNDDLIVKLISKNINPFSKFNYIKKRNQDCNTLLIENKYNLINLQESNQEVCSVLASSTNSVSMLVLTYVNDMYDREAAAKELNKTVNLMSNFNSCPEYMDNMITLVKLKKRLGL